MDELIVSGRKSRKALNKAGTILLKLDLAIYQLIGGTSLASPASAMVTASQAKNIEMTDERSPF